MKSKYRILIIDESAFIRQYLSEILSETGDFETISTGDFIKARELTRSQNFDLFTLDLWMSGGQEFLAEILGKASPELRKPVLLLNSPAQDNNDLAGLSESSAIDIIIKPSFGLKEGMAQLRDEIIGKISKAVTFKEKVPEPSLSTHFQGEKQLSGEKNNERLIVIGASTGGTVAITQLFKVLEPDLPGIIIIQHMPPVFTEAFAKTLDQVSAIHVNEAKDGDIVTAGHAMVVPGGKSLMVCRMGSGFGVKVGPPEENARYNPSIDYTMFSVAKIVGPKALGIILTGMGDDGARGLKAMFDNGSFTIAQDEKSSMIYGMPKKAVEFGGVRKVAALDDLPKEIVKWANL